MKCKMLMVFRGVSCQEFQIVFRSIIRKPSYVQLQDYTGGNLNQLQLLWSSGPSVVKMGSWT